jgi:hypothetical protein
MGDIQESPEPHGRAADLRSVDLADLAGDLRTETDTVVRRILRAPGAEHRIPVAAFNSSI